MDQSYIILIYNIKGTAAEQKKKPNLAKWRQDLDAINKLLQQSPEIKLFVKGQQAMATMFAQPPLMKFFEQYQKKMELFNKEFSPFRQALDTMSVLARAASIITLDIPIQKSLNKMIMDTRMIKPILGSSNIDYSTLAKRTKRITEDIEELVIRLSDRIKKLEAENKALREEIDSIRKKESKKKLGYIS